VPVHRSRFAWTCVALASLSCAPDDEEEHAAELFGAQEDALVAPIDCTGAGYCTSSEVRPRCLAASREGAFGFDAYQTVNVHSSAVHYGVRLVLRRAFNRTNGSFKVELREFPVNDTSIANTTLLTSGTVAGSLLPRADDTIMVRFDSPVLLAPSQGSTPRYLLLFTVSGTSLSVGLGCAVAPADLEGVSAGGRRLRKEGSAYVPAEWKANVRDVALALMDVDGSWGLDACLSTHGATCADGNTVPGDGCSASCRVETGYACHHLPSVCARNDDCAGDPCLNGSTCVDGVNSYTCACAAGWSGTNCEIDINGCAPQPCENGGACVDGLGSFTCTCPDGFAGPTCAIDLEWTRGAAAAESPSAFTTSALTVADAATGLEWQRESPSSTFSWSQAKSYCLGLSLDGRTDWRLPTRVELRSIVDSARFDPSIEAAVFTSTALDWYWTATPVANVSNAAWLVFFRYGNAFHYPTSRASHVRCVR